jgi:hypothetical protein
MIARVPYAVQVESVDSDDTQVAGRRRRNQKTKERSA